MKRTTLCFVFDGDVLLMIHKKRGQGAGKWNVPGGKIAAGESAEAGAVRECVEETGIRPVELEHRGTLEFHFAAGNNWDNTCEVFVSRKFTGSLVAENEECSAHWMPVKEIPLEKMWSSDRVWLPLLLAGKKFHRAYRFDEQDQVVEEKILDRL